VGVPRCSQRALLRAHSRLHHHPYYTPTVTTPQQGCSHPLLHPNSHTRLEAGRALAQGRHSTPLPTLGATIIAHTTPQQSHAPRSRQGSCTGPSLHAPARRGRPRLNPAAWVGGAGSSRVVTRAVTLRAVTRVESISEPLLCAPLLKSSRYASRYSARRYSSRVDTRAVTLRAVTQVESIREPLLCAPGPTPPQPRGHDPLARSSAHHRPRPPGPRLPAPSSSSATRLAA
jgi:hypothetical protein